MAEYNDNLSWSDPLVVTEERLRSLAEVIQKNVGAAASFSATLSGSRTLSSDNMEDIFSDTELSVAELKSFMVKATNYSEKNLKENISRY